MALIDLAMFFFGGLVLWLFYPIVLSVVSERAANAMLDKRWRQGIGTLRRATLINQKGKVGLRASRFDEAAGEEGVMINGSQRHFADPQGKMTTCYGKPFGIADHRKGCYTSIRDAEIAELTNQYRSDDDLVRRVNGTDWLRNYIPVPDGNRLVDLDSGVRMPDGSADPGFVMRIRNIIETMQQPYNSSNYLQYLPWLMGLGAGAGLPYFANKLGDSAGGGGFDLPIGVLIHVVGVVA